MTLSLQYVINIKITDIWGMTIFKIWWIFDIYNTSPFRLPHFQCYKKPHVSSGYHFGQHSARLVCGSDPISALKQKNKANL